MILMTLNKSILRVEYEAFFAKLKAATELQVKELSINEIQSSTKSREITLIIMRLWGSNAFTNDASKLGNSQKGTLFL